MPKPTPIDDSFADFTRKLKQRVALHRGSASIPVLEAELGVHTAWLYEAIGWLVREGSLTFDPERGIVTLRRSEDDGPGSFRSAP